MGSTAFGSSGLGSTVSGSSGPMPSIFGSAAGVIVAGLGFGLVGLGTAGADCPGLAAGSLVTEAAAGVTASGVISLTLTSDLGGSKPVKKAASVQSTHKGSILRTLSGNARSGL